MFLPILLIILLLPNFPILRFWGQERMQMVKGHQICTLSDNFASLMRCIYIAIKSVKKEHRGSHVTYLITHFSGDLVVIFV